MIFMIYGLLAVLLLTLLGWAYESLVSSQKYQKTPFGFDGVLLYKDAGNSKAFIDRKTQLLAKPDFIYQQSADEITEVEYKSRAARIYASDKAQAIASAIACREQHYITRVLIATQATQESIPIGHLSNEQLLGMIEEPYYYAKMVAEKKVVTQAKPSKVKCRHCSMRPHCDKAFS